ncbi:MAG TPA: DUF3040 domain-containing protein [Arachnia sp.]|nr:DUF3040 domain-containing protein [Arachnia sp.]HMT86326.1 DUF3040 domain-containing protein [Arachnia sp.]
MALSEQERKLLEQLEASLVADDPKLAETLRGTGQVRIHRKRATLAGLGFVVGVLVLILGVQIHPAVSIVGFVIMLASAIVGINSWQRVGGEGGRAERVPHGGPRPSNQEFMDKLEERWRRNQQGEQ